VDYDDLDSLINAFSGVERVIFIPSYADTDQRAEQGRNVAKAAEAARVRQLIFVGIMDTRADSPLPFARAYGEIEDALSASGAPAVILRTSMYTDNLEEQYPMWLKTGQLITCAGDGKISYVSRDDIVASIVGVLSSSISDYAGKTFQLTGPEALSYDDVAVIINDVFNASISVQQVEREDFADRLKEIWGVAYKGSEHVARVTPLFQTVFKQGLMSPITDHVRQLSGRAPESARSWLESHKAASE
ncbi:MAG: NmrA family NAD(P)-binding protein, partial [Pseudomonadota bacterium]